LAYRAGDEYLQAVRCRTSDTVVTIDSTGRTYAVAAHSLPSARGMGEPLSSQLNPPSGAGFRGLMSGTPESEFVLATDAGYGFVARPRGRVARSESAKAGLSAGGATVLAAVPVTEYEADYAACVRDAGRLLIRPRAELPRLARGKGGKMINIPSK